MRQYFAWSFIGVLGIMLLPQISLAQSVKRQSIGSYGSNGANNKAIIGQTIGQPYSTNTFISSEVNLTPGFQQPLSYQRVRITPELQVVSLKAFPNPAYSNFTIQSKEELENVELQVIDINGRLIFGKQLPKLTTHTINCSAWQTGMYFITVQPQDNQYRYSTKLIINNH